MNLQHVNVRIFVDGDLQIDLERVIEVFHEWVAAQSVDEMMIDVVDYRHVPAGPGVVMVGHEADYALDETGNRPALRYNRKAPLAGSNVDRFIQAYRAASKLCSRLESQFDGLKFSRLEFELAVNDRALAPNTDESRDAVATDVAAFVRTVSGSDEFSTDYDRDRRAVFGVIITLSAPAVWE